MKLFLLLFMAAVLIAGSGCVSANIPKECGETIACIVAVTDDQAAGADGHYLLDMVLYGERSGEVLSAPRILIIKGTTGSAIFGEKETGPDFIVNSKAFGEVTCKPSDVLYWLMEAKRAPEDDMVEFKSFTVVTLTSRQGKESTLLLDIPPVQLPLGQRTLLLERNGIIVQIPVDVESAETLNAIRRFSPNFPVGRKTLLRQRDGTAIEVPADPESNAP